MIHLFTKILHACLLSHFSQVPFSVTLWTTACQAPLAIGFSRQEYWSGLSCPLPEDLPKTATEIQSFISSALVGGFFTTSIQGNALSRFYFVTFCYYFLMFKGKTFILLCCSIN